jgi:hypothetical protein
VYNKTVMSSLEKTIQDAEAQIPKLAKAATKSAYRRVLASGNSVLISKNGEIIRVYADGSTESVAKNEPARKMKKGTIITIS